MARSIVAYVDETLDNARLGPVHKRVLAIITAGLFFDVIDFIILGSLVPDMLRTHFATPAGIGTVGSATLLGLFIGALGQGEFTDRFGRRTVFRFAVAFYSLATIAAALAPSIGWLVVGRLIAGIALGAAAPLSFSYAAEYSPKRIRGRVTAFMQFVGGACVWPLGTLLALSLRDTVGWRGVWIIIGLGGLAVFAASFRLPESPRWLVTHGRGDEALDQLEEMGLGRPPAGETLVADALADIRSDPMAVVFRRYRGRIIAAMICFFAFFSAAVGLGGWLPNILAERGFTITKSLSFVFGISARLSRQQPPDDVRARTLWPRPDRGHRLRPRHALVDAVLLFALGCDGAGGRVRHDLFHPARRQLDADLYLRGVPVECARFGFRAGAGRRPDRVGGVVSGNRDRQRLWLWLCDGRDRGNAGGRGLRRDPDRRRNPRARARRDRADHRIGRGRRRQLLS